jgi:hypothetical protein
MCGVYSHVSTAMRAELTAALQERWGSLTPRTSPNRAPLYRARTGPSSGAATAARGHDRLPNRSQNRRQFWSGDRGVANRPLACKNSVELRGDRGDLNP